MPRQQESLDPGTGRGQDRIHRRRYSNVRDKNAVVGEIQCPRVQDAHDIGWRRGLKADREEHNLLVRVLLSQLYSVQRRIDDTNIAARSLHREKVPAGAWHAKHVAI